MRATTATNSARGLSGVGSVAIRRTIRRRAFRRFDAGGTQQPHDGVGRLRSFGKPAQGPVAIDPDRARLRKRIVEANRFDERAVAGRPRFSDHDSVAWLLLSARAAQSHS